MSNVYPKVREQLLSWAIMSTGPNNMKVKMCGVDDTYVYDPAHNELSDLGASICITGKELSQITQTDGVLDAADPVFSGVTPGPTLAGLVVYFDWTTGTQLICHIDESVDASLPQEIASSSFGIIINADGLCQI